MRLRSAAVTLVITVLAPFGAARASVICPGDPGSTYAGWTTALPGDVGLDAAKLQTAIDWASTRTSETVRIFRHGCYVAGDRFAQGSDQSPYESFSMAKSFTSMLAGRAITLGFLGLDQTIGIYFPEADTAHKVITVRQLLTMTSGLHWNLFRDYNVLMGDRVADALSLGFDTTPGSTFEYHQTAVSLLAETIERAVQAPPHNYADIQDFAQRELLTPIGITADRWTWERDRAGNTPGFYGLRIRPLDFARLGHLMLNGGVWDGVQLIAKWYVDAAGSPTDTNHGYGYLFWTNGQGYNDYVAPTVYSRDVRSHRQILSAPVDMYMMEGMEDQRVYMIPSLDMEIVRLGVPGSREPDTRSSVFTSAPGEFEHEWFRMLMGAVTEGSVPQDPGPYAGDDPVPTLDPHSGLLYSAQHPEDGLAGFGL